MSEEPTKDLPYSSSFEERVFARFDAVDARFGSVEARFDAVEARFDVVDARFDTVDARLEKLEARANDTKPIWERALAEILKMGIEMAEVKSKVSEIETKVQILETEVATVKVDQRAARNELVDVRRALKHHVGERLDLILKFLVEGREDIRDAESRIRDLESKFA